MVKAAVFQRKNVGAGNTTEFVGSVDVVLDVGQLRMAADWKKKVRAAVAKVHANPIEAINVLSQKHKGCDVSVTLAVSAKGFGQKKKPITRGGVPIEKPKRSRKITKIVRG